MSNRTGASLRVRLNPSKGYDAFTVYFDYSATTYKSPATNHTTDFNIMNIGIRKTFR